MLYCNKNKNSVEVSKVYQESKSFDQCNHTFLPEHFGSDRVAKIITVCEQIGMIWFDLVLCINWSQNVNCSSSKPQV